MGFASAGVVIPVATPSLRSVEAATTGSGIAARPAASEHGGNNCGQRVAAMKRPRRASWLTVAVSVPTDDVMAKSA